MNLPPRVASTSRATGHVAILMGTCHGEAFLPQQLASIGEQTYADWSLWISDDSQQPATAQLLEGSRKRWEQGELAGRLHWRKGPQKGFSRNFLCLLKTPEIRADYYAFADQDDIWYADKLARAVVALAEVSPRTPALYTARTRLIDAHGRPLGLSPQATRGPGFGNALVQNIASGNTMVMNAAARRLLVQATAITGIELHDWWSYLLVSASGGAVIHDPAPCLDYRQHGGNLIGQRCGWRALSGRVANVWQGQHGRRVQRNIEALMACQDWLTADHARRLNVLYRARRGGVRQRLAGFYRAGVYRQSRAGNLAMYLAAILNRA